MCTVCGCGTAEGVSIQGFDHHHHHQPGGSKPANADALAHEHDNHHHHHHHGSHDHAHGPAAGGPARLHAVHAPGTSHARIVQVEQDILGENDRFAAANRAWLAGRGVTALNLVSSPGSGKTTLLVRTITDVQDSVPIAVIEGDQQTAFDAERIRAAGAPSVQINTGRGCHLDAHMVGHAIERLQPKSDSLLFIENVGNLVCPAAFDLGEACKVVMLSVTEGDDKPLKYPDMFAASRLMLLTKVDLLPHVAFDVERCLAHARRVNRDIEMLPVSATTGDGLGAWYDWIARRRARAPAACLAETAV